MNRFSPTGRFFRLFTSVALAIVVIISLENSVSANFSFTRPLKIGMNGEDVRALQKILNTDAQTQIQSVGPGSPGQETTYFGLLTQNAVIRFQEKYRADILVPNSLSYGTGFVGPSTLAVISRLSTGANNQVLATQVSNSSVSGSNFGTAIASNNVNASPIPPALTVSAPTSMASLPPDNPNLKNLDKFLSAVEFVSAEQGIPVETVSQFKNQILLAAATTTNLWDSFMNIQKSPNAPSAELKSPWFINSVAEIFSAIRSAFANTFVPKPAFAVEGVPFGGALVYAFECSVSKTWLLTVEPLPPTFAHLLVYDPRSPQLYLSHNIPKNHELLGDYIPKAGLCVTCPECGNIPSDGLITPIVGSSPQ